METLKYVARYTLAPLYALISLALFTAVNIWYFRLLYPYNWLSVLKFFLAMPSLLFFQFFLVEYVLRRPLFRIFGEDPLYPSDTIAISQALSYALITALYFLCFLLNGMLIACSQFGLDALPLTLQNDLHTPSTILLCADISFVIFSLMSAWNGLRAKTKEDDAWLITSDMYARFWKVFRELMF